MVGAYNILDKICDLRKKIRFLLVPNSVDGKFKIEKEFLTEYADHNSESYQTIVSEIELGLMESLQDYKSVHVKVYNLT